MQQSAVFKFLLVASASFFLVIAGCSQSQDKVATPHEADGVKDSKIENPKTGVDDTKTEVHPEAVDAYWTKERMEKAKPPEMGVVVDP
jgi:hypothetical protein